MDNKNKNRILVIDDDKEVADLIIVYLLKQGYRVVAAHTAKEGIEKFGDGDFDLVILDLNLPDANGIEVLDYIKQKVRETVVLIITGHGTSEASISSVKAGAYDFIQKPIDLQSLEVIISRALEKQGLTKQVGAFKGLLVAMILSVPIWLFVGYILSRLLS